MKTTKEAIICEFIARLSCMSGTGNGIGSSTVEKIRQFAEDEGYIKPQVCKKECK
jgi:hypothetical protein